MKRAQEQQVEEFSVQKLRENHETIQRLTSQLQQMQEQMNSMNDSGDFQDAESKYCVRLSHVSSQRVRIPSSRSLVSRDKRLPLDTWNQEYRRTFLQIKFLRLISPRDLPQIISSERVHGHREAVPGDTKVKTSLTSKDGQNYGTIPMPVCATKPMTTSSKRLDDVPQNYVVGQQRQQKIGAASRQVT